MSKVTPLSAAKDNAVEEAAAGWITAIDRGLTETEKAELARWLKSRRGNMDLLMEFAAIWDKSQALSQLSDLFPEERLEGDRFRLRQFAAAAALLLAVLILSSVDWFDVELPLELESIAAADAEFYETAIGENAIHELSDGSRISLNTNSRVRVEYSENNRLLILERGEMHIAVAHDPDRRLSVLIGDKVVQAVGTEFNVEITQDQDIELMVTEGVVMVGVVDSATNPSSQSRSLLLTQSTTIVGAGESVLIEAGDVTVDDVDPKSMKSNDIAVKLSWREGNLIFRGESLEEAVNEVGRYTAVEFIILDEDTRAIKVAGLFKAGDVEGLLAALRNHFNIAYEWDGEDRILLGARK